MRAPCRRAVSSRGAAPRRQRCRSRRARSRSPRAELHVRRGSRGKVRKRRRNRRPIAPASVTTAARPVKPGRRKTSDRAIVIGGVTGSLRALARSEAIRSARASQRSSGRPRRRGSRPGTPELALARPPAVDIRAASRSTAASPSTPGRHTCFATANASSGPNATPSRPGASSPAGRLPGADRATQARGSSSSPIEAASTSATGHVDEKRRSMAWFTNGRVPLGEVWTPREQREPSGALGRKGGDGAR